MSQPRAKVLLLAAGLGTRLRPLTERVPKCLVPVRGRPLLDYWCDSFERAGLRAVLVNTHHLPEQVRAYMARCNATRPLALHEAFEPELLGSAGTVSANRSWADDADEIVVVYADNFSTVDLAALLAFHRGHRGAFTMMLFHTPYPTKCGIAELDERGVITAFVEKPAQPKSDLANGGIYVLSAATYRAIADMQCFDMGFDVLPNYVGRMHGWVFDGYHRDIGTLEALATVEREAPRAALATAGGA